MTNPGMTSRTTEISAVYKYLASRAVSRVLEIKIQNCFFNEQTSAHISISMAPQLAWIGLGNMGRVSAPADNLIR